MQFSLNKTNLHLLISAFSKDKLAKGVRKIEKHGLDRFFGTFEAVENALHVKSGRVELTVNAVVEMPGAFAIRDAVLRELLPTLREESGLRVLAQPSGLTINGSLIQYSSDDFTYPLPQAK